ncbi:MAG: hypothetical protein IT162_07415 [Bryobacterales bacterium]|nr:hypothetical protein [Bryobacterales bacterium]
MRCLHCGNRISLLRKLKDSEFCSDEHREFYALQQQQMAVSRLMETSSPRHPAPLERPASNPGRALPKGADRRALDAQPEAAPPPAATSRRQPLTAAVKPEPPRPAPAPPAEAPAAAARVTPPVEPKRPERNSTRTCGMVQQGASSRDWSPRRWHRVEAVPVPLIPTLAAPQVERRPRRRMPMAGKIYTRLAPAALVGQFRAASWCEAPVQPGLPGSFSELLSFWLHGFACERALTVDTSAYTPEAATVEAAEPGPVPSARLVAPCDGPGTLAQRAWVEEPAWPAQPAAALPRLGAGLQGGMPAPPPPPIDEEERLMRIAESRVPGFVKLRSPRVRMPLLARLVRPATGNSGPPIRIRPSVLRPASSGQRPVLAGIPHGGRTELGFTGAAMTLSPQRVVEAALEPASRGTFPRLQLAGRALALPPATGMTALTLAARSVSAAPQQQPSGDFVPSAVVAPAIPAGPFVRGSEFDPPLGGVVKPGWRWQGLGPALEQCRKAPVSPRPVVSYRWKPVRPSLNAELDGAWNQTRTAMAPLTLSSSQTGPGSLKPAAEVEPLGVAPAAPAAFPPSPAPRSVPFGVSPQRVLKLLAIPTDSLTPRAGAIEPMSKLDPVVPRPGHLLGKSALKTQADWQRTRWSSASAYGSALWRIAVGRFSGAIGVAPRSMRLLAALAALGLAAFALLPSGGPARPAAEDTSWTVANKPAPAPSPTPVAARRMPAAERAHPVVPPAPRVRPVRAAKAAAVEPAAAAGVSWWDGVQRRLGERAAVAITDDFRNGLAEWEGAGDWARSWSYDASGFVRTGALALMAPSRELTDYRMEFLGQIERRGMGWVVRAADLRNYYALKLVVLAGDGPVPQVALIRYPVVNGMAGAASQQLLGLDARPDSVYRVQTEVRENYFAVSIQGKIVDSWTDNRLKRGGIGLFSGKGELSRVRWVGLWHQYDTLGRLCALLAPGGLPGRERGANQ